MNRLFTYFLLIAIFLLGYECVSLASNDWQYWNEIKLKHSVFERMDVHIKFEQRVVDDFKKFGLHNYAPGIVCKITEHFDFELNYKYEREKGAKKWTREHRMEMIPIVKWELNGFKFNIRNRFEYRNVESIYKWRLREKLKIKKNIELFGFEVTPFISEEIFYDFRADEFNQNRAAAGITREIFENVEISLSYMYKNNKRKDDWTVENVLKTELVIRF